MRELTKYEKTFFESGLSEQYDELMNFPPSLSDGLIRLMSTEHLNKLIQYGIQKPLTEHEARETIKKLIMAADISKKVDNLVEVISSLDKQHILEELNKIPVPVYHADAYMKRIDDALHLNVDLNKTSFGKHLKTIYQQLGEQQGTIPLDSVPKEFQSFLTDFKVCRITDRAKGMLLFGDNFAYEVTRMLYDTDDYVLYGIASTGMILPSKKEVNRRWILCCYKKELNWTKLKDEINDRLINSGQKKYIWRNLNVNELQYDNCRRTVQDIAGFKISRVYDLTVVV